MMRELKTTFLFIALAVVFSNCSEISAVSDVTKLPEKPEENLHSISKTIDCDSIYPHENIKIEFLEHDFDKSEINASFRITKNEKVLIHDSLSTQVFEVEFKDFNGDGIKDVLVQNSSDVRSNWTWYLYLASKDQQSFRRINGFERIKNPNYLEKYNLIDCYVMSGNSWTSFYQIKGDSIYDFGYVVYRGFNSDKQEYYDYDIAYETTLEKVLKK